MKSRILNDVAGFAGAAYAAASGVREEAKNAVKTQLSSLSAHLDLVPRTELDAVEKLTLKTHQEADDLKTELEAAKKQIKELQDRLLLLEETITG